MKSALAGPSHIQLARKHNLHLLGHLLKSAQDNLVAFHETVTVVGQLRLVAELADQSLHLPQVVPGHAGEEMVYSLELESTV